MYVAGKRIDYDPAGHNMYIYTFDVYIVNVYVLNDILNYIKKNSNIIIVKHVLALFEVYRYIDISTYIANSA